MKSYEQLGRAAHAAFGKASAEMFRCAPTPWEQLHPDVRQGWISVARAVADEISTVL